MIETAGTHFVHLIGYPRIGSKRELKWALERHWSDRIDRAEFDSRIDELHRSHLDEQRKLAGAATDDFFLYDENGCLVDSDQDGTDIYRGRITPRWTGSFRLEIKNLGGVYNAYRLQVD